MFGKTQKSETTGDYSPGIVGRDFIVNQTIVRDFEAINRKKWRPLSRFEYPTQNPGKDIATNYPIHLMVQLHRTFDDQGYTEFTALLGESERRTAVGDFFLFSMVTNQAKYVGNLNSAVRQLWSNSVPAERKQALQDSLNSDFRELQEGWHIKCELRLIDRFCAFRFVYDASERRLAINPHPLDDSEIIEFPDALRNTSELLVLVAKAGVGGIVNLGSVKQLGLNYSFEKLLLDILDNGVMNLDRVRINEKDPEEWDYINPAADAEIVKYTDTQ